MSFIPNFLAKIVDALVISALETGVLSLSDKLRDVFGADRWSDEEYRELSAKIASCGFGNHFPKQLLDMEKAINAANALVVQQLKKESAHNEYREFLRKLEHARIAWRNLSAYGDDPAPTPGLARAQKNFRKYGENLLMEFEIIYNRLTMPCGGDPPLLHVFADHDKNWENFAYRRAHISRDIAETGQLLSDMFLYAQKQPDYPPNDLVLLHKKLDKCVLFSSKILARMETKILELKTACLGRNCGHRTPYNKVECFTLGALISANISKDSSRLAEVLRSKFTQFAWSTVVLSGKDSAKYFRYVDPENRPLIWSQVITGTVGNKNEGETVSQPVHPKFGRLIFEHPSKTVLVFWTEKQNIFAGRWQSDFITPSRSQEVCAGCLTSFIDNWRLHELNRDYTGVRTQLLFVEERATGLPKLDVSLAQCDGQPYPLILSNGNDEGAVCAMFWSLKGTPFQANYQRLSALATNAGDNH